MTLSSRIACAGHQVHQAARGGDHDLAARGRASAAGGRSTRRRPPPRRGRGGRTRASRTRGRSGDQLAGRRQDQGLRPAVALVDLLQDRDQERGGLARPGRRVAQAVAPGQRRRRSAAPGSGSAPGSRRGPGPATSSRSRPGEGTPNGVPSRHRLQTELLLTSDLRAGWSNPIGRPVSDARFRVGLVVPGESGRTARKPPRRKKGQRKETNGQVARGGISASSRWGIHRNQSRREECNTASDRCEHQFPAGRGRTGPSAPFAGIRIVRFWPDLVHPLSHFPSAGTVSLAALDPPYEYDFRRNVSQVRWVECSEAHHAGTTTSAVTSVRQLAEPADQVERLFGRQVLRVDPPQLVEERVGQGGEEAALQGPAGLDLAASAGRASPGRGRAASRGTRGSRGRGRAPGRARRPAGRRGCRSSGRRRPGRSGAGRRSRRSLSRTATLALRSRGLVFSSSTSSW